MADSKVSVRFTEMDPHELIPFEDNPRLNDDAVPFVVNSIEDFDFLDPIEVNEDMVILSGHTRLKAALQMGLKNVRVLIISGLSEEKQMAYRIAANKTQEKAGWDFEKLDLQVEELTTQDIDVSRYGLDMSYMEDAVEELPEPEFLEEQRENPTEMDMMGFQIMIVDEEDADYERLAEVLNTEKGIPMGVAVSLMRSCNKVMGKGSAKFV